MSAHIVTDWYLSWFGLWLCCVICMLLDMIPCTLIEKDHLGDWSPEKDSNSPSQDSNHPDDLCQLRYVTPGFKPFSYLWSLMLIEEKQLVSHLPLGLLLGDGKFCHSHMCPLMWLLHLYPPQKILLITSYERASSILKHYLNLIKII